MCVVCKFIGCGVKTFSMPQRALFVPRPPPSASHSPLPHTDLRVASRAHVTFRHDLAHIYIPCHVPSTPPLCRVLRQAPICCYVFISFGPRKTHDEMRGGTRNLSFPAPKFEQFQVAKSDGAVAVGPLSWLPLLACL